VQFIQLTILLAILAPVQVLSPVEMRITSEVDAQSEQAIELLERAVNINSGTMNFEGVRSVGALFGEEFEALGFRIRASKSVSDLRQRRQPGDRPRGHRHEGRRRRHRSLTAGASSCG
jgi:hypothetical protein